MVSRVAQGPENRVERAPQDEPSSALIFQLVPWHARLGLLVARRAGSRYTVVAPGLFRPARGKNAHDWVDRMYRQTYAEIDCEVLAANVRQIVETYPDYRHYIGVVKANAYGHGDFVIDSLIEGGVNYLAASSLEECLRIRRLRQTIPVLCLGVIRPEYFDICAENRITVTIGDLDHYRAIAGSRPLKVHLKVDSGMNRLGFASAEEVHAVWEDASARGHVQVEGVYTHFATSGLYDEYWALQMERFREITSQIDLSAVDIVHVGRSLTLVHHERPPFANGVRLGIVMYGFSQSRQPPSGLRKLKRDLLMRRSGTDDVVWSNALDLRSALAIKSEIVAVKRVRAGDHIGYGAGSRVTEDSTVGIMAIGFADCRLKRGGIVEISGRRYEIVGEIGMDMTAVRIDETVRVGDEVVVYRDVRDAARSLGISAYQFLTSISDRVPRVYNRAGDVTEITYRR